MTTEQPAGETGIDVSNEATEMLGLPSALTSYVQLRYTQLTFACEAYEQFRVPILRDTDDQEMVTPEAVLANHQMIVAIGLHPKVVKWSNRWIETARSELQYFIGQPGMPDLSSVDALAARDAAITAGAIELFETLPEPVQNTVTTLAPKRVGTIVGLDVARSIIALPGPYLYAWQSDWRDAQELMSTTFGNHDLPPAPAVTSLFERINGVEADVSAIRRQMLAASAVLSPLHQDPGAPPKQ